MGNFQASLRRAGWGFVGVSMLGLAAPAFAQAVPASEDSDDGVIIVTAQKRAQNSLEVGINVSVIGSEAIAERRLESVSELAGAAPNLTVKENVPGLLPVVTIRGIGLNDFSATNNPSAGVYVDEVPLSSLALMNFNLFDVDRLEVLKGPQGTLYGRNSTAGALNIFSARPDFSGFSGRVAASLGNYQAKDFEAALNIPLGDTIALRAAGKVIAQDKGYWFNERTSENFGDRNLLLGRLQLRARPSDAIDINLKVEAQRGRSDLGQPAFFGALLAPGATCPGSPACSDFFGYRDTDNDPFRGAWSIDPFYDYNQLNLTGRIEVDLGFATLTSVTSHIDFDRQWGIDTDATPLPQTDFYTDDSVKQFSQELRLSGESRIVDWLVGGFYTRDHVVTSYDGRLQALFNTTSFTQSDQVTKSAAFFANGEWKLASTLSVVTGLRYTSEKRRNTGSTVDLVSLAPGSALSGAPFGSPPVALASVHGRISDENLSYKIGLNWKPSSRLLIYASASKGVKSGGFFAGVATSSVQLQPYGSETLYAYEAGIKGRLADVGLSYSLSGFYYDYRDVQTFIRDVAGALPIQRLGNIDKAKVKGIDADLIFNPRALPGLTATLGLGLLDSKLGAFASSGGAIPAGNRLPDAPKTSFNTSLAYSFPVGGSVDARLAIDGQYQSRTYRDALNDPIIASDGYWVWNARASVLCDKGWDVSLFAKNLFDKHYVTQGVNQLVLGFGYRVYGAPRTYGVGASFQF
jgi:iron complex outermembrane receptor protein